jgi:hypothetical protein
MDLASIIIDIATAGVEGDIVAFNLEYGYWTYQCYRGNE